MKGFNCKTLCGSQCIAIQYIKRRMNNSTTLNA